MKAIFVNVINVTDILNATKNAIYRILGIIINTATFKNASINSAKDGKFIGFAYFAPPPFYS